MLHNSKILFQTLTVYQLGDCCTVNKVCYWDQILSISKSVSEKEFDSEVRELKELVEELEMMF